jgi:hypothetical protein
LIIERIGAYRSIRCACLSLESRIDENINDLAKFHKESLGLLETPFLKASSFMSSEMQERAYQAWREYRAFNPNAFPENTIQSRACRDIQGGPITRPQAMQNQLETIRALFNN